MNPFKILGKNITTPSTTWYDKHQPRKLDEIIGNSQSIQNLQSYLDHGNIPHLILTGPNGSGKATAIKCLVNSYLDEKLRKDSCLEINGAIDRGKDVVSEKTDGKKNDRSAGMPNIISFIKKKNQTDLCKIIVIYDFDHMTTEAQMALRRIMEKYDNTRFILQCNDGSVIEAIQSRCTPLRFSSLSDEEMSQLLNRIALKEGVVLLPELRKLICLSANGDAKKGIGYLQLIAGSTNKNTDSYYKLFNLPSLENINGIIREVCKSNLQGTFNIISLLLTNGYNVDDILDILLKVMIRRTDLVHQTSYMQAISETYLLNENCSSNTHLYSLASKMISINKKGRYDPDFLY